MSGELTLTLELEPVDERDRFILEEILMIAQNNQVLPLVSFFSHHHLGLDKQEEKFVQKIMYAAGALLKANAHRRNYYRIFPELIKEIEKRPELSGSNVPLLFNKVDTNIEFEGFLAQYKSCLDLLAQSLDYVYGTKFITWESKLDKTTGRKMSGMAMVAPLGNVSKKLKPHTAPIAEIIQDNSPIITEVVEHRNSANHYGKIKKVQGFRYTPGTKDIKPPIIALNAENVIYVHEYMDANIDFLIEFVQGFLIILLSNLASGMIIGKDQNGEWGYYKKK